MGSGFGRAAVVLVLGAITAPAAPLDRPQQACVHRANRAARALAFAHGSELRRCLRRASRDREIDAQQCLTADERGRLERARERVLRAADHSDCATRPAFGLPGPTVVTPAATASSFGASADLYGSDLRPVVARRPGAEARCQARVTRHSMRLFDRALAVWVEASEEAMRDKSGSDSALADAVDAALQSDPQAALARATAKLTSAAGRRCAGLELGSLFPGPCSAAGAPHDLAACLASKMRCRSCEAAEAFGALDLDCDLFDDGEATGSCGVPASRQPRLVASSPANGDSGIVPHAWLSLDYDLPLLPDSVADVALDCGGEVQPVRVDFVPPARILVKPDFMLAGSSACTLSFQTAGEVGQIDFTTGGQQPHVILDRTIRGFAAPWPDDFHLAPDPNTASGRRLALAVGDLEGIELATAQGIAKALSRRDGFSPISPILLFVSHAIAPNSVPRDVVSSLEPGASVLLFDADPNSPTHGTRVPFDVDLRSDSALDGRMDHSLLAYPAVSLREGGRYVVAVTRAARDASGRPLVRSASYAAVAAGASPGEEPELTKARETVEPTLRFLETVPQPTLAREDIVASLHFSIRSRSHDPSDWVAVKEQALASPPPTPHIESTAASEGEVIVRGTLPLPFYLERMGFLDVSRSPTGVPEAVRYDDVPFVLRYSQAAPTPLPVVIFQHGSPGSAEDVVYFENDFLVDSGYAVIGITDITNRYFGGPGLETSLTYLVVGGALPLSNFQTHADLIGLLRTIQGMGLPGNFPALDPTRIFFRSISFGSHHALGFLPFAQEITAAVALVGAGRLAHQDLHQLETHGFDAALELAPDTRPRAIVTAFALLQNESDRDDGHLLARHLYREPIAIAGLGDTTPPSLLWIEGIGDTSIQNTATRAAAVELGVPMLRPVAEPSPVLTETDAPLAGNIEAGVTAAHFQYDPATTPSCVAVGELEGHFCPQIASEAEAQTLHLFATAAAGTPEIIDPFP